MSENLRRIQFQSLEKDFMTRIHLLVLVLSMALLSACSSDITVGTDFNTNVDFSTYRSYRWHEGNEFNLRSLQYLASDLADQRIRNSVDSALQAKGIQLR